MSQNREILFAKKLEVLRKLAKEQGNQVSEQQVTDTFAELKLSEEQLQMVFDYLVKHKVGIGQTVDLDDYLSDEEKDYLQDYLAEVAELPVYSQGEIEAFTISAMAGQADAQQKLIQVYLKDVAQIAKLYTGQGVFLEDLIGEGNVALTIGVTMLGSLEEPSEASGMLAHMMMNAMEDLVARTNDDRVSDEKIAAKVNKVADKARELAQEYHRKVTVQELAMETNLSEKAILDACRMSGRKIEDIDYAQDDL